MSGDPRRDVSETVTFTRALRALGREGGNVLVVGRNVTGHALTCDRLLGDSVSELRHRLLVRTEPSSCPSAHPSECADGVVSYSSGEDTSAGGLSSLGAEIVGRVDEAGRLGPSQLRLCVDSLEPLLADHPTAHVFRLLHAVTARVRRESGVGHYHLPLEREHEDVALLEPLFDAILEVRTRNGNVEQRWHLQEEATTSSWLSL